MTETQVNGYMLDTNIFNRLADGEIDLEAFAGFRMFATHVQLNELSVAKLNDRTAALLEAFKQIGPEVIVTSSADWDVSEWDKANWTPEDGVFQKIKNRIVELDAKAGKKRHSLVNPQRDALYLDTAIRSRLIVV